jgi:hypothetical protein
MNFLGRWLNNNGPPIINGPRWTRTLKVGVGTTLIGMGLSNVVFGRLHVYPNVAAGLVTGTITWSRF